MRTASIAWLLVVAGPLSLLFSQLFAAPEETAALPKAFIDGTAPGWRELAEQHFVNVNCDPDTWSWKDGVVHCTGKPVGVVRSDRQFTNFELVAEWRHLKSAGNSGIFVWAPEEVLEGLKPNSLPKAGVEVQILDHGFAEQYELKNKKKGDWFTTHGDVFPVGKSKMSRKIFLEAVAMVWKLRFDAMRGKL